MGTLLGVSITLILVGGLIKLEEFLNPPCIIIEEEPDDTWVRENLVCGKALPGPPPLDEDFYKKDKNVEVIPAD